MRGRDPTWSPAGDRLAFTTEQVVFDDPAMYVVNRDGSGLRRITPRRLEPSDPAWSRDGEWIAFIGSPLEGGVRRLYLVRPDGKDLRRLIPADFAPAWLPRMPRS